jgi:CRP/FNR family transcriptional regulator, cyclic AMP receptor protein
VLLCLRIKAISAAIFPLCLPWSVPILTAIWHLPRLWRANVTDIDMRAYAKGAGVNVAFPEGSIVFREGDPGSCMYVVQSGVVEILIDDKVVEVCGPNEAIGFMSMIDGARRSSTARVKEAVELSIIDQRKFRFMVDEVPNFSIYIMGVMARRIRSMGQAM